MSKIEVNTVEPQCGTTLTLGASGDTVQLGTGASQTGFGRTGTVDWQTGSIKTTTFTATNGEGYFANTSGGAFTMNLPAGTAGAIVSVVDYTNTFDTFNLTISPNGTDRIGGTNADVPLSTQGQSVTFVYVDGIEGWKNTMDSTSNVIGASYICASVSGACNTLATCGNYKIATFKGPGTFTVASASQIACNNVVDYVVVAGGGGGGSGCGAGGGAGAGGFRLFADDTVNPQTGPGAPLNGYGTPSPSGVAVTVSAIAYPITVGGGGALGPGAGAPGCGSNGGPSTFSTITSTGGGGAAGGNSGPTASGNPGGSGGGATRNRGSVGAGNTPSTTPPQGNNGGSGSDTLGGDGGGGALAVGGCNQATPSPSQGFGGNGGAGAGITGFGTTGQLCGGQYYFSGGGGGGTYMGCAASPAPGSNGRGGIGGGGLGGNACGVPNQPSGDGEAATVNTGGGGGGGTEITGSPTNPGTNDGNGGTGGSGIVIIKYRFQA